MILYGIKNCDTVKKARKWLEAHRVEYRFHDLRVDGLDPTRLSTWVRAIGWEALLNRRGTTWRGLSESERADLDEERAMALMLAHPSLIKRPVLEYGGALRVGFDEADYAERFA